MTDDVWVYVSGTGDATLHPTRHDAETAAADDPDAWIERTRLCEPTGAPSAGETTPSADPDASTCQTRPQGRMWIAPPVLTVPGNLFWNPWHDGDDAA